MIRLGKVAGSVFISQSAEHERFLLENLMINTVAFLACNFPAYLQMINWTSQCFLITVLCNLVSLTMSNVAKVNKG